MSSNFDPFGKKQIAELSEQLATLETQNEELRTQLATSQAQRKTALERAEKAEAEATTARQSLTEFETRLKASMQRLGRLLAVGDLHWLDPDSVMDIAIQVPALGETHTLLVNGRPVLAGSKGAMLAEAARIVDARNAPTTSESS